MIIFTMLKHLEIDSDIQKSIRTFRNRFGNLEIDSDIQKSISTFRHLEIDSDIQKSIRTFGLLKIDLDIQKSIRTFRHLEIDSDICFEQICGISVKWYMGLPQLSECVCIYHHVVPRSIPKHTICSLSIKSCTIIVIVLTTGQNKHKQIAFVSKF